MNIWLDGKKIDYQENLLGAIQEELKEENRVVKSLLVNEVEVINSTLEEIFAEEAPGKRVQIETMPTEELVQESMALAREYVPRLSQGLPQLRGHLLGGNIGEFRVMVDQALEGLEWLILTLQAFISLDTTGKWEETFLHEYILLASSLVELERALREDNLELISDLMEGQVVPFLDKVEQVIQEYHRL